MEKEVKEFNTTTQDIELIKTQVSKANTIASSLEIKTPDDLIHATDILSRIKIVGKMIASKKDSIIKPLDTALRNARELFRPIEDEWAGAEKIVKMKMGVYHDAEILKAKKKLKKIEEQVASKKITKEKAVEKIEVITPSKKVEAKSGSIQFRTHRDVIIEDETKLTREYLLPNTVKIRKDALAGIEIKGVKVVEKQIVAGTIN